MSVALTEFLTPRASGGVRFVLNRSLIPNRKPKASSEKSASERKINTNVGCPRSSRSSVRWVSPFLPVLVPVLARPLPFIAAPITPKAV